MKQKLQNFCNIIKQAVSAGLSKLSGKRGRASGRKVHTWAAPQALQSAVHSASQYYTSLGKHRLLYVLTACLLLVMTPVCIALCIPFHSASAGTDDSLHINSTGVLSAAAVEAAEPPKIYSADPGFVNPVVAQMQERLMAHFLYGRRRTFQLLW